MASEYNNNGQYSRHSILRYEKIFGDGFVSSGGADVTYSFCDRLELPKGAKILDIGSGLGGAAFYLADKFDATVIGIDLSPVMVEIASERAKEKGYERVTFQLGDIRKLEFEPESFDLIWSRDSLLHIPEKKELFPRLHGWLKKGGQVMFSDYAQSKPPHSPEFTEYVQKSGYDLMDLKTYSQLIKDAGFPEVIVDDWTDYFVETLRREQKNLIDNRDKFLADFSQEDLDYLYDRWERKIGYCQAGDMKVGLWHARKHA